MGEFGHYVNVEFLDGGNGDDGGAVGHRTSDELADLVKCVCVCV